ncbi:toxin-antitoxin system, antitoxin component, ribbon-helix-helix domain protein [Ancylostoma duodenale]|uniref:Toxin-antitoxin system, antitoxin component, ribbon-helix-helix domain protein n=1 Tax=Ancylostoma duodenale TaxID=51022 RepID=A0A0C2HIU6_9BILA|nr:toxin-antitoxin system, antitoxin component, ribbon-helix-helix domain protein [Ancylostoma duodenale]
MLRVGLAARAAGYDTTNKSLRILSPRIGKQEEVHEEMSVLSPDIMLQRDEIDLEKNAMLELLMETSGATFGIKKALEHMAKRDQSLPENTVQMTKEDVEDTLGKKERLKIDVIQRMERTYNSEQVTVRRSLIIYTWTVSTDHDLPLQTE